MSILSATEEHTQKAQTQSNQFPELKCALEHCNDVLSDLTKLKTHFDGVGPQSQLTWERMGWAEAELENVRSKLSVYINVLNVLNTRMIR